jgi:hypothetical protein
MRGEIQLSIEELSGGQFESLEAAQDEALADLAGDLLKTVRRLAGEGALVVSNGNTIISFEIDDRWLKYG